MTRKSLQRSATLAVAASLSFGVAAQAVPAQAAPAATVRTVQTAQAARTAQVQTLAVKAKAKKKTRAQRNKAIAKKLVKKRGWSTRQYKCLVKLWNRESHWNHKAGNASGAYGIPQALPGKKMRSAGKDWRTNPRTQIKWGLGYIKKRYKTPCRALNHSSAQGWY
ncbi:transglycosylase SLT domain-containing protein [Actinomadura parmotrematis]|uniref:aggregation-promoting factor C-terminal-like domain-containing protein n=1 Tax=Actinomadura parmotrematis TaxID=2864039 RepID=UPI0035576A80